QPRCGPVRRHARRGDARRPDRRGRADQPGARGARPRIHARAARRRPRKEQGMTPTDDRAPRRLRIDDLTELAVPSQPALSPDGSQVVYVVRALDAEADRNVDQLWLVPTTGGASRRLTHGPADTAPVWSPDGSRVAFLRDGQLAVVGLEGGEVEPVTDLLL